MKEKEVLDRLANKLSDAPYLELRKLEIEIDADKIILRGSVRSFFLKQMAQCSVKAECNGYEIQNLIEVIPQ